AQVASLYIFVITHFFNHQSCCAPGLPCSPGLTYHSGHDDRSKKAEGTVIFGSGLRFCLRDGPSHRPEQFSLSCMGTCAKEGRTKIPVSIPSPSLVRDKEHSRRPVILSGSPIRWEHPLKCYSNTTLCIFAEKARNNRNTNLPASETDPVGDLSLMSRSLSQPSGCVSSIAIFLGEEFHHLSADSILPAIRSGE